MPTGNPAQRVTSAVRVRDELARADTVTELLDRAHVMWCGDGCACSTECTFLHYPRTAPVSARPRAPRSRYNKDTADLFFLMGADGYAPGIPQRHQVNLWSLLRKSTPDVAGLAYSDWSRKNAASASELVRFSCRDSIQWMANWCGSRYAEQPTGIHYIAFSTICDDLCIPPLDLVHGRFRLYDQTMADMATSLDDHGWGEGGARALLSLARQYVVQYLEKADRGLHRQLNALPGVWDAVVHRTHTANCYGAAVVVARVCDAGPVTFAWLQDSAVCDAISMDLCKIAMDVYRRDQHQPTGTDSDGEARRRDAYHSLYLDLIDDLVYSGAPEPLVHFGRAGFLFVQLQDRYHERRIGRRLPLRPAIVAWLDELFGEIPTSRLVDGLFAEAAPGPPSGEDVE